MYIQKTLFPIFLYIISRVPTLTFHTYRIEPIDPVNRKKTINTPQNVYSIFLEFLFIAMNSRTILNIKRITAQGDAKKLMKRGGGWGGGAW